MSEHLIQQDGFHPMRGHVFDGARVLCGDGSVLTIVSEMRGWAVCHSSGQVVGRAESADGVTQIVVSFGAGEGRG